MPNINTMDNRSGKLVDGEGNVVNEADYIALDPNGGEVLTVAEAGVVELTVPEGTIAAVITNPGVAVRIAFGDAEASDTVGTRYPAGSNPALTSPAQCETASVYFEAACPGAYVQYYK
jgi:hypothetical protein